MNVDYINPFIEAVYETFTTFLECPVERGDVDIQRDIPPNRDIAALIGLSGPARGIVALSVPVNTALALVGKMVGSDMRVVDDKLRDGVAELVSIVAGKAKAKFIEGTGARIDLSLPSVVRGNSFKVDKPTSSVWLGVPFTTELGDFSLRVTFEFKEM